ncbi:unnamed protein product [Caenorhabditis auriculariae]|uniref:Uncharacterized protein n=1 Tax=Caenorhabditis auriculariae TaxID=2777116 RepID=A0A8S1GZH9_9PELO|nr:unnamed protein product [Caenorhabditis auriculariae]
MLNTQAPEAVIDVLERTCAPTADAYNRLEDAMMRRTSSALFSFGKVFTVLKGYSDLNFLLAASEKDWFSCR